MKLDSTVTRLFTEPLCSPGDLGRPIPDSPHAVSACLPTWRDNVSYEEGEARVVEKLTTGYPRFVYNRFCRDLFAECLRRFGSVGDSCLAFPSQHSAEQCAEFVRAKADGPVQVHDIGKCGAWCVTFPQSAAAVAKSFWQHAGVGISSRQAAAVLQDSPLISSGGVAMKSTLRQRIAGTFGVAAKDVWLFPTGMSAFYTLHRALLQLFPGRKLAQFGFPYVDSLKIAQVFGPGAHFFPRGDDADLQALGELLSADPVCGIATEFPANPLLTVPDLSRLSGMAREHNCPLIVDDTVAGAWNVDVLPAADVVWSSLTKYFSGRGDVTGGSLVVNRNSPFAGPLTDSLSQVYDDLLWDGDAAALELNSRDAAERVAAISRNARALAEFLNDHPAVQYVYYPSIGGRSAFDAYRRPQGGYGGLLSVVLRDAEQETAKFYDRLRVCKGPNLGMNYTLACPFTILAHYTELDFAESCGVSRWLIRVAVGLEPIDDLIARFREALAGIK
ncbi:MAG: PLP-dependent transferase [Planctomycetaceae bacterium]|nr:PLP-dependent transferase [Planctomycetaceae bacterium]